MSLAFFKKNKLVFLFFVLLLITRVYFASSRIYNQDDLGATSTMLDFPTAASGADAVASGMTYGPLQYYLTYPLLKLSTDPDIFIFLARFMSVLAGIFSVILIYFSFKAKDQDEPDRLAKILTFSLAVLSVPAILRAQQGYPYAVCALIVALLVYCVPGMITQDSKSREFKKHLFIFILTLFAGVGFNHQLIFASIIAVLFIVFHWLKQKTFIKSILSHIFVLTFSAVAYLYTVEKMYSLYIKPKLALGLNNPTWIVSTNPAFLESLPLGLGQIIYRLFNPFYEILIYNFTPIHPQLVNPLAFNLVGVAFFIFVSLGCIFVLKNKFNSQTENQLRFKFSLLVIAGYYLLYVFDLMPFGSTRHSHLFFAPLAILIFEALFFVFSVIKNKFTRQVIAYSFLGLNFSGFLIYYSGFNQFTSNQFSYPDLKNVIQSQRVSYLGTYGAFQIKNIGYFYNLQNLLINPDITWPNLKEHFIASLKQAPSNTKFLIVAQNSSPVDFVTNLLKENNLTHLKSELIRNKPGYGNDEILVKHETNGYFLLEITIP